MRRDRKIYSSMKEIKRNIEIVFCFLLNWISGSIIPNVINPASPVLLSALHVDKENTIWHRRNPSRYKSHEIHALSPVFLQMTGSPYSTNSSQSPSHVHVANANVFSPLVY